MNAEVQINVSVKSALRDTGVRWKPTNIYIHDFHLTTDLDNYLTETPTFCTTVWDYKYFQDGALTDPVTHYTVRLGNPTHPTPPKGLLPMPKGHLDGSLTNEAFATSDTLKDILNGIIGDMKTVAKY